MTSTFDPIRYRTTTRAQWEEAAEAWYQWGPTIEAWLGNATARMLDAARVGDGSRVLDVAAGAGGQSLAAARRVGPSGHVLGHRHLAGNPRVRAKAATDAGLTNVATREIDGERLTVAADAFDAVISRVGLIYSPDQQAALSGMRDALRPDGRISGVIYSTADRNGFFSIPVSIIRRRAQLAPPQAGQPGPLSLGAPGVAERVLNDAGFRDVDVEVVSSPVRMASAADCVRFGRESFGALQQMLVGLAQADRKAAWAEMEDALRQFEGPDGFTGPCEMLVVSATR